MQHESSGRVTFPTAAGTAEGYLAIPESGSGPGLIVIQEWWGLVPHIEAVCDRFAGHGFVALAPDLYHGEATREPDEAGRKMQELAVADAARDLEGAVDHLLSRDEVTGDTVGVMGFCMGGALALVTADATPDKVGAVASFYGVFWYGDPDLGDVRAPVLMHIGTHDEFIPVERVEEIATSIREGGASVRVEVHEGAGHAFYNDTRPEAYHEDAAARAESETLAFLRAHLT